MLLILTSVPACLPAQGFLHYCQHYRVPGELVFWKRDVDKDIFSCDSQPLPLPEPQAVADLLAPLDSIAQPPPPAQSTEAKLIKGAWRLHTRHTRPSRHGLGVGCLSVGSGLAQAWQHDGHMASGMGGICCDG